MICLFSEKFTDTEFLVDPQYLEMGKFVFIRLKFVVVIIRQGLSFLMKTGMKVSIRKLKVTD